MEMMTKKTRKTFVVLWGAVLAIALMIGFIPQMAEPVYADGTVNVNYIDRWWNSSTSTPFVDQKTERTEYTIVTSSDGAVTWSTGWYAVTKDATIKGDIQFTEDVHLVLCDGATLTVEGAIVGSENKNISIYSVLSR